MNLEIHKRQLAERINALLQRRHLQGMDELLEEALDALDEKFPAEAAPPKEASTSFS